MATSGIFSTSALYDTTQTTLSSQPQSQAASNTANAATTGAASQQDSVKLSTAGQAKLLHQEGQSVSAIASSLGTDTKAINNYLGITLDKALEQAIEATLSAKA
jgi:hypothetical protein